MKIDINNYEEYFLLYIDNELSLQERMDVDNFLVENEELKNEFDMLKSTVSEPESEIHLLDKSFLFRKEIEWINGNNYEEIFVLYHDKELNGEQKETTEQFLLSHPELKEEFILLGKVKLEPENDLIFKDKKSLYRKEKDGKVIPLILWRSLAAAVFLGFGLWLFVNQGEKLSLQNPVATLVNQSEKTTNPTVESLTDIVKEAKPQNQQVAIADPAKEQNNPTNKNTSGNKITVTASFVGNKKAGKVFQKIRTDIITEKTGQTEQIASAEISNNQIQRLRSALLVEDNGALDPAGDNAKIKTSSVNNIKVSTAAYITPEESNDNYIFYNIPAEKFTKSKVGAFLKKMKRIVDRNDPLKLIFSGEEKQVARIN